MAKQKSKSTQAAAPAKLDAAESLVRIMCPYPDIEHLTEAELEALHVFKFEVITCTHKLFMRISKKKAAPVVARVVKKWADTLEE